MLTMTALNPAWYNAAVRDSAESIFFSKSLDPSKTMGRFCQRQNKNKVYIVIINHNSGQQFNMLNGLLFLVTHCLYSMNLYEITYIMQAGAAAVPS